MAEMPPWSRHSAVTSDTESMTKIASDLVEREFSEVFDADACQKPLAAYSAAQVDRLFPDLFDSSSEDSGLGGTLLETPTGYDEKDYLYPSLSRNEYARLNLLWYHTRNIAEDEQLLASMQVKVDLLRSIVGWDYGICGILDAHAFHRIVTSNITTAVLPRRESTCSHTIQGIEVGSILAVSDLSRDWRFRKSPPVAKGGLRSYTGTPIFCKTDRGELAAIGSLCVASGTPNLSLTGAQRNALVRFAEMVSSDIVSKSQLNRREQQQRMGELLANVTYQREPDETQILGIVEQIYPAAEIAVCHIADGSVLLRKSEERSIPIAEIRGGLWEDTAAIRQVIEQHNHEAPQSNRFVRGVVGMFSGRPFNRALVVASTDMCYVFDDIDGWFVDRCANMLSSIAHQRALKEARQAKDRFLRGITHQLRTPIHGVLASIDLLGEELRTSGGGSLQNSPDLSRSMSVFGSKQIGQSSLPTALNTLDFIRTIRNSGRELMSTVNNMIALTRWEAVMDSEQVQRLTELDMLEEAILDEALKQSPDLEADRICLLFDNQLPVHASAAVLMMDQVQHCVSLLLVNALQYTPRGCVIIKISTHNSDCSKLVFDIMDTGIGIKAANQARIFEAFEKEDELGRGAGLGLTIASRIASALSGRVSLVSSSETGSHFRAEFNDPGLACMMARPPRQKSPEASQLRTFYIIPTEPRTLTINHFEQVLLARGMKRGETESCDLTVVTYLPIQSYFNDALHQARDVRGPTLCLLPIEEDIDVLQEEHPHINFFLGPFTTARLDDILEQMEEKARTLHKAIVSSAIAQPIIAEGAVTDAATIRTPESNSTPDVEHDPFTGGATSATLAYRPKRPARPLTLLVDDNKINLNIVKIYCTKRSLPFLTAMNGLEAIAAFAGALERQDPVRLILLDLQMPKCDGIQACRRIREMEREKGVAEKERCAIFIVTGQDGPLDRKRAMEAGADQFYVKPLGLKELDRNIARYFDVQL